MIIVKKTCGCSPEIPYSFNKLTSAVAECLREKNECVHPRYLALNEQSDTVRCQGMVFRYAVLWRAGSGCFMLKDEARLAKEKGKYILSLYSICVFRSTTL